MNQTIKLDIGAGTTADYLARWLNHANDRVRARTYQGYEGLTRLYAAPSIGEIPLQDLHPLHLQSLYASLMNERIPPIAAGTVLNLHLVLTQAFKQAVGWGLLDRSPVSGAQPPRPHRREPAVVDAELTTRILVAARGQSIELPVAIAIATGMRRGEILGLRWRDLDEDFSVARLVIGRARYSSESRGFDCGDSVGPLGVGMLFRTYLNADRMIA